MEQENSLDLDNLNLILSVLKNNKNETKENNLLKINSNNNLKNILPIISDNNENIYKIFNYIEINQFLNKYKETSKNIEKDKKLDLKKEALIHIKDNINEKNRYLVDIFLKAIEIKHIMQNNYNRGDI